MNRVFADTSGWGSFFLVNDPHHAKAASLMTQWRCQKRDIVTTNYVLSELIVLLSRASGQKRPGVLHHIETIRSAAWVEIVHIDPSLDQKAWQFLKKRLDKKWSLVDATSFVVMEDRGLTEALTADKDFEQAGFVRLLNESSIVR